MKRVSAILICVLMILFAAVPIFAGGIDDGGACPNCGHSPTSFRARHFYLCSGGYEEYVCPECGYVFRVGIAPSHEWVLSESNWTCLTGGYEIMTCNRCGIQNKKTIAPRDHAYAYVETVQPTKLQDGYFLLRCSVCGAEAQERIPAITSGRAGADPGVVVSAGAGAAIAGAVLFLLLKKKKKTEEPNAAAAAGSAVPAAASAASDLAAEAAFPGELPEFELSRKSVLWPTSEKYKIDSFKDFLMKQRYIQLAVVNMDEEGAQEKLLHDCSENEPDLVLQVAGEGETPESLEKKLSAITGTCPNTAFGIVVDPKADASLWEALPKMKEDGKILSYCRADGNHYQAITALFLPIYKPEFTLDTGLDAVSEIADAFGVPGVSRAIGLYHSAQSLKELEGKEKNLSNAVAVVSIIAGEMGWERISGITDFVSKAEETVGLVKEEYNRQDNKS